MIHCMTIHVNDQSIKRCLGISILWPMHMALFYLLHIHTNKIYHSQAENIPLRRVRWAEVITIKCVNYNFGFFNLEYFPCILIHLSRKQPVFGYFRPLCHLIRLNKNGQPQKNRTEGCLIKSKSSPKENLQKDILSYPPLLKRQESTNVQQCQTFFNVLTGFAEFFFFLFFLFFFS